MISIRSTRHVQKILLGCINLFSRKWKILEHQIPHQNILLVQENARGNADKNWEPDSSLCETDVNAHPRVVGDGGGRPPTTGSKIVAFIDRSSKYRRQKMLTGQTGLKITLPESTLAQRDRRVSVSGKPLCECQLWPPSTPPFRWR